jgi:hypothetical protein
MLIASPFRRDLKDSATDPHDRLACSGHAALGRSRSPTRGRRHDRTLVEDVLADSQMQAERFRCAIGGSAGWLASVGTHFGSTLVAER